MMRLSVAVYALLAVVALASAACPCSDAKFCKPLEHPPTGKELFVFTINPGGWTAFNMTYVTTLVPFYPLSQDPTLLCHAHERNIRVSLQAEGFPLRNLTNAGDRTAWAKRQAQLVMEAGADGLNIDIEDPITDPREPSLLTELVAETTAAMHALNPKAQVSFDVAWSPNHIDGRAYDYAGLAKACDLLFVMGYDERSQVWSGPCVAGANAGLEQTTSGFDAYLSLNIPAEHLVLGVPWYGRLYPCTSLVDDVCSIALVPFRGCNCSDAAANEIPLDQIPVPPSGPTWDPITSSEFFNINGTHQMWYDDARSLSQKYVMAKSRQARGVGMWTGDMSTQPAMWQAFDWFFKP